jgi:hypothetical protein
MTQKEINNLAFGVVAMVPMVNDYFAVLAKE